MKRFVTAAVTGAMLFISSAAYGACISWAEAEKAIKANWENKYPGEKILKIESTGAAYTSDKFEDTGRETSDPSGNKYRVLQKEQYCKAPAKVTIQRASGSQAAFSISVIFKKSGAKYAFAGFGVGEVQELSKKGQDGLPRAEIEKMIAEAWVKDRPEVKVRKVTITEPKFRQAQGRWWYDLDADIYTFEDNSNKLCKRKNVSLFRGTKMGEDDGKDPNAPWKIELLGGTHRCSME